MSKKTIAQPALLNKEYRLIVDSFLWISQVASS